MILNWDHNEIVDAFDVEGGKASKRSDKVAYLLLESLPNIPNIEGRDQWCLRSSK